MNAHFTAFVPVLKTQEFPQILWRLQAPLQYYSVVAGQWIIVPEGFITDGCSIPRLPFIYLLAGDKAEEAGYVHDWLYTSQMFPRETCDAILREAVIAMGYDEFLANSMYDAVRMFGASHWALPNQPQGEKVASQISALAATTLGAS